MTDADDGLVAAGNLGEAARRSADAGDFARASELYERACDFSQAALQALAAGNTTRAMLMAVLSGDEDVALRVERQLLDDGDVANAAQLLSDRGSHRFSARLWRAAAEWERAAAAFERAADRAAAATCYDKAGNPGAAARLLEAELRAGQGAAPLRLELARLYARHGKHRAVVRTLGPLRDELAEQPVAWKGDALWLLVDALGELDMAHAAGELRRRLDKLAVPRPSAAPLAPAHDERTLFGRYSLVREVAVTPHATVVECRDVLSGDRVALKLLSTKAQGTGRDALDRFVREARALERLRHPHVVRLRDYLPQGPAMVLDWMAGGSLRDLLDREAISPARAAEVVRAVLSAVAEAHRLGIVHRDIKPANVLFDEGGNPMLADFGAAHLSESGATMTAGAIGTMAYMAPEQRQGGKATAVSDVYAVGVLLFEMLSGRLPEDDSAVSPLHPDLDANHDAFAAKLLAERPADRYGHAREAIEALDQLPWSTRIAEREWLPPSSRSPATLPDERLTGDGPHRDQWLERDVLLLDWQEHRERVAAFARADHPALATVLRVDRAAGVVWIERIAGEPLGRPLEASERRRLTEALAALHAVGGCHGAVDREHVVSVVGTCYLTFPDSPGGDAASDRAALERL